MGGNFTFEHPNEARLHTSFIIAGREVYMSDMASGLARAKVLHCMHAAKLIVPHLAGWSSPTCMQSRAD